MTQASDPRAPDQVRSFVGLPIDEALRGRIGDVLGSLRDGCRGVRLVALANLHLTLRFLGPAGEAARAQIGEAIAAAASACPPLQARVSGLGVFPERGAPRVLWLGIEAPAALLRLQQACERAAVGAGFPRESRRFRSHVTLGRWRDRAAAPRLPSLDWGAASFDRVVLWKSELHKDGARYVPLAEHPLSAPREL